MSFPTAEEREKIRNDIRNREHASNQRVAEATQRILAVSAELHLTVYEFEKVFEKVKHRAVISVSSENGNW